MPIIAPIEEAWFEQPTDFVPVCPHLALKFAFLPHGRTFYDAVSITLGTINTGTNGSSSVCAGGRSLFYTRNVTTAQYKQINAFNPGTADFWVLVSGTFIGVALPVVALSNNVKGVSANNQWRLQPNSDGSATIANAFCFLTYDGTLTNVGLGAAFTDGEYCTFLGVRRGTTHELWKNGSLVASTTGTVRNCSAATGQDIGFGWGNSEVYTADGHRTLGAGGICTLSQSMASKISRTPWQIFAP